MVEFNRKWSNLIKNKAFSIKFDKFLIKFDHFWYKFEVRFEFGPRFWIVATISMDYNNKFGSKMSIQTRFKYNLDWIFGRPRSNHISLVPSWYKEQYSLNPEQNIHIYSVKVVILVRWILSIFVIIIHISK